MHICIMDMKIRRNDLKSFFDHIPVFNRKRRKVQTNKKILKNMFKKMTQ